VNGRVIGLEAHSLAHGDRIEVGGEELEFFLD
jgi:hypothetical protein